MSILFRKGKRIFAAGLLATSATCLVFPTIAAAQTLNIRLNADIRSSEPGINRDANSDAIVAHVVEGLVGYRADASVGPLLAESYKISEDGLTYTFVLRQDVTFHNGKPLRAADVLSSWARYTNPANGWRCLPDVNGEGLQKVVDVSASDERTVIFRLEKPSALFLNTLARTDCGGTGIFHSASVDAAGAWVKPIGTGPFEFSDWQRGQYVELQKFNRYRSVVGKRDGYVGKKDPLVDAVRFSIIPDDSAAKAALLSGGIDIISDVSSDDVAELQANPEVKVQSAPGLGVNGLLFQTRDPLLDDPRMRAAIELALDLPQIAEVITRGQAEASVSIVPKASAYYGETQSVLPSRDVEEARTLVAASGYGGEPITLLTTQRYPALFDLAVLSQALLMEAGINLNIEVLDWATLLDRYNAGNYSMMAFTFSARLDPTLSFDSISGNKAEQPRKVWDNPDALALIKKSGTITNEKDRQAIFDELEMMFRADKPMIPVYAGARTGAWRSNVEGYESWSVGYPRAWGVSKAAD